ncbi:glycosyltransferase [Arthrobacter sp. NIO-1057]|uniref:glycosyltransferase n=1 Tax=Arthrobacter sp. NIO-1057 TaxID=993071 RepID=UPI00071E61B6|nr:glycosyltransferase [Arthrobacter sp. NIO-1057]KSU67805.1 glucosyl transferase [Arthrobacter sp. NIO-1057]SCB79578.1 UDP:flavonoid glycosyltransferase YjiC, YdhE family [Arthrobacter sp. NIO-1057]
MRILILAPGTHGDVAPMAGLGKTLRQQGFEVTIAANPNYRDLVTSAGSTFRELSGDMSALVNPAAPGTKTSATDIRYYLQELGSYFNQAATGALAAAQHGTDLILTNSVAPFGFDIAEALDIPAIGAHLQPNEPSGDYPPLALGTARSFGRLGNKTLHQLLTRAKAPYDSPTAQIRAELGLSKRSRATSECVRRKTRQPILHGFSSIVVPHVADCHEGIVNCGYWWPVSDSSWQPSGQLLDFLSAGEPPVLIGFGSTHALDLDFLVDVAHRTGRRTIIQGAGDFVESDILGVGTVPHEWLLPQVATVVHHAGAGTSASGLRAGIPAVPVPIFTDQPFWASRLQHLGASVSPIPYKNLTIDRLTAGINEVLNNEHFAQNAKLVSQRLASEEDGTLVAARFLEQYKPQQ